MSYKLIFTTISMILLTGFIFAQPRFGRHMPDDKVMKKIDQYEKMKLMETLELDETTGIKFFNHRREFRDKGRQLNQILDSLMEKADDLASMSKTDLNSVTYKKLTEEILKYEAEHHKLHNDFIISLESILTPEQVLKYQVFEKNFRQELQELMFRRGKRGNPPPPGE